MAGFSRDSYKDNHLIRLYASSDRRLEKSTDEIVTILEENPKVELVDVISSLGIPQEGSSHRRILVCHDNEDALTALKNRDPRRVFTTSSIPSSRSAAFMFPGMGDHYVNMGLGIYQSEGVFRDMVDYCSDFLKPLLGCDLKEVLFHLRNGPEVESKEGLSVPGKNRSGIDLRRMVRSIEDHPNEEGSHTLDLIIHAHAAIFVIEFALARLLMEWGIRPGGMIGYSIGEYVAACIAEVLSLEDALYLVCERAKLIQELPPGGMLAISLPEKEVESLLYGSLSISAINGPSLTVISGESGDVLLLEERLADTGVACRPLQSSHPFHSRILEPVLDSFIRLVENVELRQPKIPYISNVTGNWITADEATNPLYWGDHLIKAVRFSDGIKALHEKDDYALLEVGPGNTLSYIVMQNPVCSSRRDRLALTFLRHRFDTQSDTLFFLNALGKLWLEGVHMDWGRVCQVGNEPTHPLATGEHGTESRGENSQIDSLRVNLQESCFPPTNAIESKIVRIWQDLLGVDKVGIHDNFFNLGGNSLMGTQHISRMREAYPIDLPLSALFEKPTAAEQARIIEEMLVESIENLSDEEVEKLL